MTDEVRPSHTDEAKQTIETLNRTKLVFELIKGAAAAVLAITGLFGCSEITIANERLEQLRLSNENVDMWNSTIKFQNDVMANLNSMQTLVENTVAGGNQEKINLTAIQVNNMLASSNSMIKVLCPNWEQGSFTCPSDPAQATTRGGSTGTTENPNRLIIPLLAAQSANLVAMSARLQSYCAGPANPCNRTPEVVANRDNLIEAQATGAPTNIPVRIGSPASSVTQPSSQPNGMPSGAGGSQTPSQQQPRTTAVTLNSATALATGWDVDIFICDDNAAARSQGDRIAEQLVQRSAQSPTIANGVSLGRIRKRYMDDAMIKRLAAREYGLPAVFLRANDNPDELRAAQALAGAAGIAPGNIRSAISPTPWYISVFVCPSA